VEKKSVDLKYTSLELTELWDSRIVLGELKYGESDRDEIRNALKSVGYTSGIQDNCIDALLKGSTEQIPVALAYTVDEAVNLHYHFDFYLDDDVIERWITTRQIDEIDLSFPVKKYDPLLTFSQPPRTVLIYPNGRKKVLRTRDDCTVGLFQGKNSIPDSDPTVLISEIDGFAHRDLYGKVSVYPIKTYPNLGRIHGLIDDDSAIQIERDVTKGSQIITPSNLAVGGLIRGSHIEVEGNLKTRHGLDNSLKEENASITAGQSIYTSFIQSYQVWAGMYIIVNKMIDKSKVQCLNTIITTDIKQSEIRVSKKLFVMNISNNCIIYLGPSYLSDAAFRARKNIHIQHAKRISDIEAHLEDQKLLLSSERQKAMGHLSKLNKLSKNLIASDELLNRIYYNLEQGIKNVDQKIVEYEEAQEVYEREKFQINYYKSQLNGFENPEIRVYGQLEQGTKIMTPNDFLKIKDTVENVSIKIDPSTEKLILKKY